MNLKIVSTFLLNICLLSKSLVAGIDVNDGLNGYLFLNLTQEYYKYYSTSKPWTDAQKICDDEDGILWHPKNIEEAGAVVALFKLNFWFLVGITDKEVEGVFKTVDGIPIADVYRNWATNQPDNSGDEDCAQLYLPTGLNDIACSTSYPFVCKKTKKHWSQWNEECGISSLDANKVKEYRRLNITQDYYKFHKAATWTEAKEICESEDSVLWHPKNKNEAQAVLCLVRPENWIHVGLTDAAHEGSFETVDGIHISEVYNKWNKYQPDNAGNENCVQMNTAYGLNDVSCSSVYPFICKKTKNDLVQWNRHCNKNGLDILNHRNALRKGYDYIEALQAFYKFHTISETWSDAKRICESEGAQLFYPKNRDEMRKVLSFFKQTDLFSCMFIGVSDLFFNGIFETVDGVLLDDVYYYWQSGEPNQLNCSENCITVNDKGHLNDDSCSKKYPFVCKYTVNMHNWNNKCNIANLDYTYNEEQGKCYKLHKKALSWTKAYRVCRSEHSYLAVINSKRERDHILSLTRDSSDQVTEVLPRKPIHVGIYNTFDEGWLTVRGTTLEDSGFVHWDEDHPRRIIQRNEDRCGSMSYTGRLLDVTCDTESFFVCEHDINI